MYLALLTVKNFRRLKEVTIEFSPGLNVLVGPNNVGKTAVVDGLRALLAGVDDPYPRFDLDDIHKPQGAQASGDIVFEFIFRDLSNDDEADFLHAIRPGSDGKTEARLGVTYGNADKAGRLQARRWCGDHQDIALSSGMLDNLRSVYLPPLRDAASGLRPSRTSQLSRLLHLLTDDPAKEQLKAELVKLDEDLKKHKPIVDAQKAITTRHSSMLGPKLVQVLEVGLSASDFQKLAARLSILVDALEIDSNGLGYNNLIYMAVVLSELAKNQQAAYRSLIVEEPEAHLHPQLQAVLLRYLTDIKATEGEKPVQVFVTSHSPNFASLAKLDSLVCLVDVSKTVESFHPRTIKFDKGKREKLERYLDVTRAELFFARRVIFVEGAAELMMVSILAKRLNVDLRDHGISLISVEGLNFDCFLPLFGKSGIRVPVAVLTDADPQAGVDADGDPIPLYPAATDKVTVSANTQSMLAMQDAFIGVFHGVKTFEYDFALHDCNRQAMIAALKDIHPQIGTKLEVAVKSAPDDASKAKALFTGMFERKQNNVQKGRFAQALAARIEDDALEIAVPSYISAAIQHVNS